MSRRSARLRPILRKVLEQVSDAFGRKKPEEALSSIDAATRLGSDVVSVRLFQARGFALRSARRLEESAMAFVAAADAAERFGWLARSVTALDQAGLSCWSRSDYHKGLSVAERRLTLEKARANDASLAVTLGNIGNIHAHRGDGAAAAQAHIAKQGRWKHPYFWAAWQLWGLAE
jgi:hypothetical protein